MNIHLDIFKPCCNFFNSFKYAIKPPIIICLPKFTSTSENGNWTNSLSFFLFFEGFPLPSPPPPLHNDDNLDFCQAQPKLQLKLKLGLSWL